MIFLLLLGLLAPACNAHAQEVNTGTHSTLDRALVEKLTLDELLLGLSIARCSLIAKPIFGEIQQIVDRHVHATDPDPSIYTYAACGNSCIYLLHMLVYVRMESLLVTEGNTEYAALFKTCKQPPMTLQKIEAEAPNLVGAQLYNDLKTLADQLSIDALMTFLLASPCFHSPSVLGDLLSPQRWFTEDDIEISAHYRLFYAKVQELMKRECSQEQRTVFNFQHTPENFAILVATNNESPSHV